MRLSTISSDIDAFEIKETTKSIANVNESKAVIRWDSALDAQESSRSSVELPGDDRDSRSPSPDIGALIMGYEDDDMFQKPLLSHSKSVSQKCIMAKWTLQYFMNHTQHFLKKYPRY